MSRRMRSLLEFQNRPYCHDTSIAPLSKLGNGDFARQANNTVLRTKRTTGVPKVACDNLSRAHRIVAFDRSIILRERESLSLAVLAGEKRSSRRLMECFIQAKNTKKVNKDIMRPCENVEKKIWNAAAHTETHARNKATRKCVPMAKSNV